MITLAPLSAVDADAVETLLDAAFGRDRHGKTAYRLREGVDPIPELSLAAFDDGDLIGTIQCWPIELAQDDGSATPLILVGPVAVRPDRQRDGTGKLLMVEMLRRADAAGRDPLLLVGDADYYERFFGFTAAATAEWRLPGPVERHRLLARIPQGVALPREGFVRARMSSRLLR
jgi:predicted N-acetyltransferase YhbS